MDVSISRYKHTLDTVQCDITLKTNLIKAYKIIIKVQKLYGRTNGRTQGDSISALRRR